MRLVTFLYLYIFAFCITVGLFSPQIISAKTTIDVSNNGDNSKTNVNVESNTGENTICQNGNCTTTGSNKGSSSVCVNGKCFTDQDGNVDYESEDGNTKVNINTNSSSNTTSGSVEGVNITNENILNKDITGIEEEKKKIKQKVEDQKKKLEKQEKKITEQKNILQELIDDVRNFFKNWFR